MCIQHNNLSMHRANTSKFSGNRILRLLFFLILKLKKKTNLRLIFELRTEYRVLGCPSPLLYKHTILIKLSIFYGVPPPPPVFGMTFPANEGVHLASASILISGCSAVSISLSRSAGMQSLVLGSRHAGLLATLWTSLYMLLPLANPIFSMFLHSCLTFQGLLLSYISSITKATTGLSGWRLVHCSNSNKQLGRVS